MPMTRHCWAANPRIRPSMRAHAPLHPASTATPSRPGRRMLVLALLAFGLGQPAAAQTAEALHLRSLAATCAACHGSDGKPPEGSAIPRLAGLPRDDFLARVRGFRDGSRPATVMHQLGRGYTDAQLTALADYFARQR